jgi:hypothetical protein
MSKPSPSKSAPAKKTAPAVSEDGLVRVYHLNRSKGSFIHGEHRLAPGGSAAVPESVAELWLGHKDSGGAPLCALSESANPVSDAKADAEKARLEGELKAAGEQNADLQARLDNLEKALKEAEAKAAGAP